MTWLENKIIDITTTKVFYYEESKEKIVNRICDELKIDLFPSIDHNSYFSRSNGKWKKIELKDEQKLKYDLNVFEPEIIENLEKAPSNILFVFEGECFKGLLHFTDYGKKAIYETLYKNFFEFEKTLKQYLVANGYGYDKFLKYFEYKIKKDKDEKTHKFFQKLIDDTKERENFPNLDLYDLSTILSFCISRFHRKPILNFDKSFTIISGDKTKGSIGNLRNIIMHSRDATGMTETLPHDFKKFKELFFNQVIEFEKAFRILQRAWDDKHIEKRNNDNSKILDYLDSLDNNQLRQKFFDYDKYL